MSTEAADVPTLHADANDVRHGGHPNDVYYVRIAIGLAVITACEVGWSYLSIWNGATGVKAFCEAAGLLLMMAIKFVIVASNFMHLKFDDKILTRVFYAGLCLAIGVYTAVLTTLHVFG